MELLRNSYTFDDILLVPAYADFEREDVNISSALFGEVYKLPIISSPMDTITGFNMTRAMEIAGGLGVLHRYQDKDYLKQAIEWGYAIAIAPRLGSEFLLGIDSPTVFLDVAHGETKRNIEFCRELVAKRMNVVSGNIVTPQAVERYMKVGVKTFRVGIGSGSVCTTRTVAGVGFPQAHAIKKLRDQFGDDITIISDGGHRTTGDIVKALALGADFVMLGGMLAGTDEALGKNNFRGMASKDAVFEYKGNDDDFIAEGINKEVKPKGPVADVMKEIEKAIRLGCYYTGSRNLRELQDTEIVFITQNSYLEGLAR